MISAHIEKLLTENHPRTVALRQYLSNACTEFENSGLADKNFIRELTSGSVQKFWACVSEALIFVRLGEKHFGTRAAIGKGPDFLVMDGTRKVWIEVVCPEPINVPTNWLDPIPGKEITFPHEEILLRWTSAIRVKAEKLVGSQDETHKGYLSSGLVAPADAYVIAVNGCQLSNGQFPELFGISQFPFAVEAVFPVGPYQVKIDRDTLKAVDCGHQHRPFVSNQNARVPQLNL